MQVWGDTAAVARLDAAAGKDHFASAPRDRSGVGDALNQFLWAGGRLVDAWPATPDDNAYASPRTSAIETLLISGEVDGSTPAQNATRETLPHLPNGHQVVLKGFGHTVDCWNNQTAAGTHLIMTFLDTGKVDDSRYTPQRIDFTPDVTQTALAKRIVAVMAGLALLAVLSLAAAAWRVRRRGRLGRVARVALRSVYALVLGLGGLCAAVLITLIATPAVQIDTAPVVVASVAIPIALGAYLAWVDVDRPRIAGLASALAGAQLGAWLGFAAAPVAARTAHRDRRCHRRHEPAADRRRHRRGAPTRDSARGHAGDLRCTSGGAGGLRPARSPAGERNASRLSGSASASSCSTCSRPAASSCTR